MKDARNSRKNRIRAVAQAGMIAGMYVALTYVFQPLSFGMVQVRVSEALTILPWFTPVAVPGLFAGCLLGNLLSGAMLPDIIFGSVATLLGALGTRMLKKRPLWLGTLPPILANTLIIPFILKYAYGLENAMWLLFLTIGVGELASCGLLGTFLGLGLKKRPEVFQSEEKK